MYINDVNVIYNNYNKTNTKTIYNLIKSCLFDVSTTIK